MANDMSITVKDIAKMAGVSHTTVLKALNDKPRISEGLKEKIKKLAEENNYVINANARSLALRQNKVIGLVITDISIPLFAEMAKAIEEVARESGYNVIVSCSENDSKKENEAIVSLLELRVAGVIITPSYKGTEYVRNLNQAKVPSIVLGKLEGTDCDYITFDDRAATYKAAKFLTEIGHRKIACLIHGSMDTNPFKYWVEGYKMALKEEGMEFNPEYMIECGTTPDSGYRSARELILLSDRPTAVIDFSDTNVIGVTRGLKDNGIRIPQDMSLVVLQDDDTFKYTTPSISAVSFPAYDLGKLSAEYLLKKIVQKKGDSKKIMLPVELIVRESTCKL